jgi:hypothetical protein
MGHRCRLHHQRQANCLRQSKKGVLTGAIVGEKYCKFLRGISCGCGLINKADSI